MGVRISYLAFVDFVPETAMRKVISHGGSPVNVDM
jgi:hypothetical protein